MRESFILARFFQRGDSENREEPPASRDARQLPRSTVDLYATENPTALAMTRVH